MGRLILSILFFVCCLAKAQDTSFKTRKAFPVLGNFTDFTVDNLGNIYLVINKTQVKKLNSFGDSIAVYNVRWYGNITSIDVSNPFKVLIFYKESSTIVITDRLLNVVNTIDLRRNKLPQVKVLSASYDNNIWLFDESESKIRKIDMNGKQLLESVDLRTVFNETPSFNVMFDNNKQLFLYDVKQGWFVFDYYGAFLKKYSFPNWKDPQVVNGTMIGRTDSTCLFAPKGDFDYKSIKPVYKMSGILKMHIANNHTYVLYPGKFEIFDAP